MSRVAVIRNKTKPSDQDVYTMVKKAVDHLGGIKSIVQEGDKVALKPNVVTGELSGPGVTTDKRVVEALIRLCQEAGAGKILFFEGAGYFTETSKALKLSGYIDLAEKYGAEVVDVDKSPVVKVAVPDALLVNPVISNIIVDAIIVIITPSYICLITVISFIFIPVHSTIKPYKNANSKYAIHHIISTYQCISQSS